MKIAIISDTHDRVENFQKAIALINSQRIKILIHCGDLRTPAMLDELVKFDGEIHVVLGNLDDPLLTAAKAKKMKVNFHGEIARLELDRRKVAATHLPRVAESIAQSGEYDAVFYGHTHVAAKRLVGKTLFCNPGELMGRLGTKSFAIYDTKANDAEILDIE